MLCGGYWELGKADLVSRLELFPAHDGHRCHISQGGLTVRRNNPNIQGLSIIVSHSCNISMWVFSSSLPHSDLGNPGSFHFVALPFSRASESAAGFFASGWQMVEGKESGGFMSLA